MPMTRLSTSRTATEVERELTVLRLGRRPYEDVWSLQKDLVHRRKRGEIGDTLVLVEHDPVYTVGKSGDDNHLLQSRLPDVPVFHVERGGDVTFHGPGQLVGYPIMDLHDHRLSVSWYMRTLEEVLMRTLGHFGIHSGRQEGLTGVWVGNEKIASLGVRLSRWISMHGFALNVNVDLSFFDGIIPCGIFDHDVTSMKTILGFPQELAKVEEGTVAEFMNTFQFDSVHEHQNT